MTKRRTMIKGSTVLMVALATGCASMPLSTNPAANVGPNGGAGLISNNAGGLISNNAGGLISNNAGGLISNNAGGLISNNAGGLISNNAGGLISNNAGGLISNNAGGLISNNAGGLTGVVRGPAAGLISNNAGGLISNNAGGLISNNAGGLISNNAGGLISNNAGGYHLMSAEQGDDLTEAIPNAKVAVFNERGEMLSYNWVITDQNGAYTVPRLKASGPVVFVKAVYQREGKQVVLVATAPAPRKPGLIDVTVSPATSIVAKKLNEMIKRRAVSVASVSAQAVDRITKTLAPVMTPKAVVAAALLPQAEVSTTFDTMLKQSPVLASAVSTVTASQGISNVVAVTPPTVATPVTTAAEAAGVTSAAAPDLVAAGVAIPVDTGNGTITTIDSTTGATLSTTTVPVTTDTTTTTATDTSGGTTTTSSGTTTDTTGGTTTTSGGTTIDTTGGTTTTSGGTTTTSGGTTTTSTGTITDTATPAPAPSDTTTTTTTTATPTPVSATPTPAPTPTPTLIGTIFTLGVVSGIPHVETQFGTNSFSAGLSTGITSAVVTNFTTPITFVEDGSTLARGVAFDGSTPYYLVDNTIVGPNGTVVISALGTGEATDIAIMGGVAYVTSATWNTIYRVDLATGNATPFAGTPNNTGSWADGQGGSAQFNSPEGICAAGGVLYVADLYNYRIRAISADGTVSTVAGSGVGKLDGAGAAASFGGPFDVTADDKGNLFVADELNNTIRKIVLSTQAVTTIAGNGKISTVDGTGSSASFFYPVSVSWGKANGQDMLVVGQSNKKIRVVSGF